LTTNLKIACYKTKQREKTAFGRTIEVWTETQMMIRHCKRQHTTTNYNQIFSTTYFLLNNKD